MEPGRRIIHASHLKALRRLLYIPNIDLTPLDIVYNKSHLSILIHVKDGTKRKVVILFLFLQEVRWGHCLLARSTYYA
jgi:hypothetical protein